MAALTANGVGTCGADDNQAQAGHLIAQPSTVIGGGLVHSLTSEGHDASEDGTGRGTPIVAVDLYNGAIDGDVTHTLRLGNGGTQSVPSVAGHWEGAFHMKQDPISSETHTPCMSANASIGVMVQPLALRGREGGAELEAGKVGAPANALRSAGGGGGGSLYPLVSISNTDTPVSFAENQQGELRESTVAGTLNTGGGKPGTGYQAIRHKTIVRRLTELECERLQGYPDGWTDGQTASARYRQLGNSVAVPCVEWIARRLIATDKEINQ